MYKKDNSQTYLSTAYSIGRQLSRDAIWSPDKRCNWQGASTLIVNEKSQPVTITLKNNLYKGLSGIALFLTELWLRIPDSIIRETINGSIKNIISQHHKTSYPYPFSFFLGNLGIGYTLWYLGMKLKTPALRKQGLSIIYKLNEIKLKSYEIDVIEGAAGAIPILLRIYNYEKEPLLLDMADRCGQFLVKNAKKNEDWCYWTSEGLGLTGYSHGAAGISVALLELYETMKKSEYLHIANMGFNFERKYYNNKEKNWPDFRSCTDYSDEKKSYLSMWCHGAPGIALSRIKAYKLSNQIQFLEEAKIALETTYNKTQSLIDNTPQVSFSMCHGLAGNGMILLIGGKVLNEQKYLNLAYEIADLGIKLYENTGLNWPSGVNGLRGVDGKFAYSPNFMLGNSGIGYFYLRTAFFSEIPSILLL